MFPWAEIGTNYEYAEEESMSKKEIQEQQHEIDQVIEEMEKRWISNMVARKEIEQYTGGAITAKTAANLDSLGIGCPGRFKLGGSVVYPTVNMTPWLKSRVRRSR